MNLQPGIFLKSTALLNNTNFESAIIYIAEINHKGALGFIINRSYNRFLNELEEFKNVAPVPLYDGGPVDEEHLFFLHRRPEIISEGEFVNNGIYLGGNFKQAIAAVKDEKISTADIK